jgi:hypothetical protein
MHIMTIEKAPLPDTKDDTDAYMAPPLNGGEMIELALRVQDSIPTITGKINTDNIFVANRARMDLNEVYGHTIAALIDVVGEHGIDFASHAPAAKDANEILPDIINNAHFIAGKLHEKKDEFKQLRPEQLEDPSKSINSILLVVATTSSKKQIEGKKLIPVADAIEQQIQLSLGLLMDTVELAEVKGTSVSTSSVFTKHFSAIAEILDTYSPTPSTE